MKTALAALAIGIATAVGAQAGPSWGFQLGNGAGFQWNGGRHYQTSAPQCMPRHTERRHYQTVTYVGPQYYRMSGAPCGTRIRNHMNAPVVVDYHNSGGRRESIVIPRSW